MDPQPTERDWLHPDDPRHGTYNAYVNLRCRCLFCRDANRRHVADARQRRARTELNPNDPRHGTANLYQNYGCRCKPCRQANTLASKTYAP